MWCTMMHHAVATRYKLLLNSAGLNTQWSLLGDVVASVERCMDLWNDNTSSVMIQSYTTFVITTLNLNSELLLRSRPPCKMKKKTKEKRNRYLNEVVENESCDSDEFYRMKKVIPRAAGTTDNYKGSSRHRTHKGPLKRPKEEGVLVIVALHLSPGDRRTAGFSVLDPAKKTMLEVHKQVQYIVACLSFPLSLSLDRREQTNTVHVLCLFSL